MAAGNVLNFMVVIITGVQNVFRTDRKLFAANIEKMAIKQSTKCTKTPYLEKLK